MKSLFLKALLPVTLGSSLVLVSCGQKDLGKVDLKTEEEKTFYAVGAMFGSRLSNLSLTDAEVMALAAGISDASKNQKLKVEVGEYNRKIQEVFQARMSKGSEDNKKKGAEYIEKFVKNEGATKLPSGIAYKMLKEGTGASPKETETVEVHYHGTLMDGTVFDSSVERGQKVKFPLNRVIKGWTEGLQHLKVGGKMKLMIPADLAYGDAGAPPKIPGGATLTFEVELFSISATEAEPAMPAAKAAPAPAAKKAKK